MSKTLQSLWADDAGAILAVEWVFFVTILIIGLVCGLKSVQHSVNTELEEVAAAIGSLSQSYSFAGTQRCCGVDPLTGQIRYGCRTNGSSFSDQTNLFPVESCVEGTDRVGVICPD
jgi:Flp pilus assembly pilin Flp